MGEKPKILVLTHPITVAKAFGVAALTIAVPAHSDQPPTPRSHSILSFEIVPRVTAAANQGPIVTIALAGIPMNDFTSISGITGGIAKSLLESRFGKNAPNKGNDHYIGLQPREAHETELMTKHPATVSLDLIPGLWLLDYKELARLVPQTPCKLTYSVMSKCANSAASPK